jgi:hypothetical protein
MHRGNRHKIQRYFTTINYSEIRSTYKSIYRMNKKAILVISIISLVLTTLGLVIDSDPRNDSLWTTSFEYIVMLMITFTVFLLFYAITNFVYTQVKRKIV